MDSNWCPRIFPFPPRRAAGGFLAALLAWAAAPSTLRGQDAPSSAADHAVVQALMRLPEGTLDELPQRRDAVLRYLRQRAGTEEYLRVVERLQVFDQTDILHQMLVASPLTTLNVDAGRLLLRAGRIDVVRQALGDGKVDRAATAALALGHLGTPEAIALLQQIVGDAHARRQVRIAAATGLCRSVPGQRFLLELVRRGELGDDIRFAVTDGLLGSKNQRIREEARLVLEPPATSQREPLPPISQLANRRGHAQRGKIVFATDGTCIKCHKVNGDGREIGPDLSEIGSKLSREDMFVAILDPSAAISHNYETYTLLDADGRVLTGLLMNRTDDEITLRDSEGIDHTVAVQDVEELKQQPTSLMPADLQKAMSLQDLLDVVEYLSTLRKPAPRPSAPESSRTKASGPPRQIDRDDPTAEILAFEVAPGVQVELFAAEPMVRNPTSIDVDAQGRVWVCEAVNYRHFRNPNNPERKEGDRIVVLEDSDGDGRADKSTLFYQSREIDSPHGVCVLGNRVLVSAGANIFVFTDQDGDLKADRKEVLFTGIEGVQHDHGIHAVGIGPDGKLYFNFGNEGRRLLSADGQPIIDAAGNIVDDRRQPYQQGMVFRCDLDGTHVETLGWNFRNNWEVCVDPFGNLWQSDNDDDGNRGTRINFVMEFGNYGYRDEKTGASWQTPRIGMAEEIPLRHWHLNDPGVVPNLLQTGAGSPTGICFYTGELLPPAFRNQIIHCDPGPNVVRAYPTEPDGAGYSASVVNLINGAGDSWFRPVDVCAAPDGSLIIADWYDPGVGGHRMGDPDHGRLFRVVPTGHAGYRVPPLELDTPAGSVAALASPNRATRFLAQQALLGLGEAAIAELTRARDSGASESMRALALWQLARVGGSPAEQVEWAMGQANPDLRIVGIRMARRHGLDVVPIVERWLHDPSPQVRRELLIALRHNTDSRVPRLWAELALQHDGQDRWYLEALGIAADGQWEPFFEAWLDRVGEGWDTPTGRDIIWRSRSPKACPLLAAIIRRCRSEQEQYRYFRAFDFHAASARNAALKSLVAGD